jgi:hypothetical protein
MRCPYCGGLNQERALFCVNCGRDLRRAQPNTQPQRPPTQAPQQSGHPTNQPNHQRAGSSAQPQHSGYPAQAPRPQAQAAPAANTRRQPASTNRPPAIAPLVLPPPPPEPEAPAPFPPRTMAHFEALLASGTQTYTIAESHIENNQRKVVTIAYPRCANWQQAATLLKALKENQEERYSTIVIRGIFPQQQDAYAFTNGQLQFDRNVRLGSQIGKRYMLETGNGYAADSLRCVLNE